jgi:hypothetical protein
MLILLGERSDVILGVEPMMCLGKRLCYAQREVDGMPQGEVMSFLERDDTVLRKEMVILPLK